MSEIYTLSAKLWRWTTDKAPAAWHFITIDGDAAEAIRAAALMDRLERTGSSRQIGWGSVKISAQIGETAWQTSIFPAKEVDGFLLPVKASVRKAEEIADGDVIMLTIRL